MYHLHNERSSPTRNNYNAVHGQVSVVAQRGKESIFSTVDECPNPKEIDECEEQVTRRPSAPVKTPMKDINSTPKRVVSHS